ncbi:MAG: hypothetical protein COW13_05070 [Candidatus Omnitrophica bacterium CG12_big_fil_rev_8_21_14_0_65_50_5]|nr:MAG: hypothetical protein COW13_05070 [Candidatus Omnitrophica bacterium CG12_big_fil_rev_8_21_14_0_65_50_5]
MKHRGPYCVYIVQCADGTYYTGYTNDLAGRLALHNSGRGAKYVRSRLPVALVYTKQYRYHKKALQAERDIKKLTRSQKEKLAGTYAGTND